MPKHDCIPVQHACPQLNIRSFSFSFSSTYPLDPNNITFFTKKKRHAALSTVRIAHSIHCVWSCLFARDVLKPGSIDRPLHSSWFTTTCSPLLIHLPSPSRSKTIIDSFDPAKLNGLWYEQAYIDVAQIGATCQTLNSTFVPHEHDWSLPSPSSTSGDTINGNVVMAFKVNYGKIPFTITELYTQNQPPANGSYTKTAEVPGGKLLKLDTVFVSNFLYFSYCKSHLS